MEQVLSQLNEIFKDTLDNDDILLTIQTTAADIDEWDSLSHIMLFVGIEKHFKIKFTSIEIAGFKNIGELVKTIENKLN